MYGKVIRTVKTQKGTESNSRTARAWNVKFWFFSTASVCFERVMNFYCSAFFYVSVGVLQTEVWSKIFCMKLKAEVRMFVSYFISDSSFEERPTKLLTYWSKPGMTILWSWLLPPFCPNTSCNMAMVYSIFFLSLGCINCISKFHNFYKYICN
jgi:hypothetical protein